MKHRILFAAYRDWSVDVLKHVEKHPRVFNVKHVRTNEEITEEILHRRTNYDFVLLCGWSWQPDKSVIENIPVFSEHPCTSDRYSPGTPLQNQILDGVKYTKHRLVKVGYPELIDRSYCHEVDIDISGNMDYILQQMNSTSKMLYNLFLDDYPDVTWKQWNLDQNQISRRTKDQSRLTKEQIMKMSSTEIYNFCRMLENPYPNAFIEDDEGIVYIERVSYRSKK